ncbi:MAG: enoyl-CoA hydratase/isomerase family protein [Pseudomonadota bacterium]
MDQGSKHFVNYEARPPVALITLNRPEVLNAWTMAMRGTLIDALGQARKDPSIGAVVITGAGDRAFCAGQDLNELVDFKPDAAREWIDSFRRLYAAVRSLEIPVVAALNGVAAGSAFQFTLLTDVRVGHDGVRLGQPEINSGIASITGPWIMREVLGLSRTIEMTLTGRLMNADDAMRLGALHHLVPATEVLSRSMAIANDLAAKPPQAMRLIKRRIWETLKPGFDDAMDAAIRYHEESFASGEAATESQRFLDRSK